MVGDRVLKATSSFDAICAGEALLELATAGAPTSLRLKPGGGVVSVALGLAKNGLRVGLATTLWDDRFGRALREKATLAGIDASGVVLSPISSLVFIEGATGEIAPWREEEHPIAIPASWSAPLLLLSGLTPTVSHGASMCKAARAARRAGTLVVLDVQARWFLWAGHDPRAVRMLLREVDVCCCTTDDLTVLDMSTTELRAALRPSAVLVVTHGANALAMGPFGEAATPPCDVQPTTAIGDAFVTAVCASLARRGEAREHREDAWDAMLMRGQAAARSLAQPRSSSSATTR